MEQKINVGGQMLQVRTARSMGWSNGWARQTQAKDSSYESQRQGIWEDKVTRSDRDPMRQLVGQLGRAGVTMAGMRLDQHDPHIIARNFLASEARRDKQFGNLWVAMTPAQANQLVEALASQCGNQRMASSALAHKRRLSQWRHRDLLRSQGWTLNKD